MTSVRSNNCLYIEKYKTLSTTVIQDTAIFNLTARMDSFMYYTSTFTLHNHDAKSGKFGFKSSNFGHWDWGAKNTIFEEEKM